MYTDDSIITGHTEKDINEAIQAIKTTNLDVTEEGDINDFLGVNIKRNTDGSILFRQPLLIDSILRDLRLESDGKSR